jgi:tryptophan-rich sensory protein
MCFIIALRRSIFNVDSTRTQKRRESVDWKKQRHLFFSRALRRMASVWSFVAWDALALVGWLISCLALGELVVLYWIPVFTSMNRWMLRPRSLVFGLWFAVFQLVGIGAWFTWKSQHHHHNNGWSEHPVMLAFSCSLLFVSTAWNVTFFWAQRIQLAAYVSIVNLGLGITTTIMFYRVDVVGGILLTVADVALLYVFCWNATFNYRNTNGYNPTKRLPVQIDANKPLPHPNVWAAVFRPCPYENEHENLVQKTLVLRAKSELNARAVELAKSAPLGSTSAPPFETTPDARV